MSLVGSSSGDGKENGPVVMDLRDLSPFDHTPFSERA